MSLSVVRTINDFAPFGKVRTLVAIVPKIFTILYSKMKNQIKPSIDRKPVTKKLNKPSFSGSTEMAAENERSFDSSLATFLDSERFRMSVRNIWIVKVTRNFFWLCYCTHDLTAKNIRTKLSSNWCDFWLRCLKSHLKWFLFSFVPNNRKWFQTFKKMNFDGKWNFFFKIWNFWKKLVICRFFLLCFGCGIKFSANSFKSFYDYELSSLDGTVPFKFNA